MNLYADLQAVQQASIALNGIDDDLIAQLLLSLADSIEKHSHFLLNENGKDLARMSPDNPKYDRLQLTESRLRGIAEDMRKVATLPSPVGELLSETQRPNGMTIKKVRVPFGVIGIIYEARPNVTFDVFSLCLRSHNACVLKGGKDAEYSNLAAMQVIKAELDNFGLDPNTALLMPNDHAATATLLQAVEYVDLIIPRGSQSLIQFVRDNAKVPVIETGAGICHCYFDKSGDIQKGAAIVNNAKTRRVSVCNALDCLLVHCDRLQDLPALCHDLAASKVTIYADATAYESLQGHYPTDLLQMAQDEHFGTEFLDYKMSIKTVDSIEKALSHIRRYSSKHSECIVTEDDSAKAIFQAKVDAACVYVNVSTAFTDG
ncbi:MAG: glutamate-5-semialdehyde dehydrogenase, partial [Bacteroidales bacterium]|nr:glutamate-5-semialdehyde dehydrogenase [Bacteroidales bacterium]